VEKILLPFPKEVMIIGSLVKTGGKEEVLFSSGSNIL